MKKKKQCFKFIMPFEQNIVIFNRDLSEMSKTVVIPGGPGK